MAESRKKGMSKHIKLIVQILFFAALTILAFYYILKDDPKKTFAILSQARALPLATAFLIVIGTLFLDGLSLTILTRLYYPKYRYMQGVLNVMGSGLVGVYVKSAAPLLQAVTFQKQNVKESEAASVLTMNFLLYQLSICLYSTVILIFGFPIVKNVPLALLGNMKLIYLVLIGMAVELLFLIGALLLAYCHPLHRLFLNSGINLLARLHLLREPEKTRKRLTVQFATYRIEMKRMKENLLPVTSVLFLDLIRQFLFGILPFLVIVSLVPDLFYNPDFFAQSLTGTGFVNVLSSFLTVGAPEVTFQDTFSYFLKDVSSVSNPTSIASAANIIWRLLTFYLLFFIGILTVAFYRGSPKRKEILSSTGTIYNLELSEIEGADQETVSYLKEIRKKGKRDQAPLLSEEEIVSSFVSLRDTILENDKKENGKEEEADISAILEEQKANLAKVSKEYEEMVEATPSQAEIEKESQKDLRLFAEKKKRKSEKEEQRQKKKKERKEAREKKELIRRQPKGTTITIDEISGMEIHTPEFTEMKTMTTSDPEEDRK